jgi:hypothetical protein
MTVTAKYDERRISEKYWCEPPPKRLAPDYPTQPSFPHIRKRSQIVDRIDRTWLNLLPSNIGLAGKHFPHAAS